MTIRQTRSRLDALACVGVGVALLLPVAATAQSIAPEYGTSMKIACAPRLASTPDQSLTITGSQDGDSRGFFGPADALVINGGRAEGVEVGREYFVRRIIPRGIRGASVILKTAGWIRVVAVDEHSAIATIVRPCDRLQRGDFLEPAEWPTLPPPGALGEPAYDAAGIVLFGLDGRGMMGTGEYLVISLGTNNQMAVGQRLTVFRRTLGEDGPVTELAKAIAVAVYSDASTVRLVEARDAVTVGDLIAPHR